MASNRTRLVLAVGLVLLTVVAGCSGAGLGGGGDAGAPSDGDGGAGGGDGGLAPDEGGGPDDGAELPPLTERELIYTGRVVLEVEEFEAARLNLTAAARAHGGFVSDARTALHGAEGREYRTGEVVLRVPRGNFSPLMTRVEASGTVRHAETSTTDVTDQLVDIGARLDSLRTQRDRLRELYAGANDTEEVLAVEARLSAVQTEIERLEARQASLERRVAYSTITVELRERPPETPTEHWYDVGFVGALLASVDGVVVTLRALVVALGYALPYLLVFGVPAVAAGYGILRWRRREGG